MYTQSLYQKIVYMFFCSVFLFFFLLSGSALHFLEFINHFIFHCKSFQSFTQDTKKTKVIFNGHRLYRESLIPPSRCLSNDCILFDLLGGMCYLHLHLFLSYISNVLSLKGSHGFQKHMHWEKIPCDVNVPFPHSFS